MGKQAIQLGTRLVRAVPNVLWLAPVVVAVYYAAFLLRFEGRLEANGWYVFQATLAPLLAIKLVVFRLLPGFRGWNRMVTFDDLLDLAKAATVCSLVLIVVDHLIMTRVNVPRSIVLIDWGMTIMVIGGLRCITRLVRERDMTLFGNRNHPAVFIAGVNASGEAVLRAIRRSASLDFRVAGFLAEAEQEVGARIGGVPVVGLLADACELSQKHQVREILISADGLPGQQVRALVENAQEAGINVKVLPSYEQLLHGTVDLRPRTVSIEDLLRRDPVALDQRQLHKWIDGKVVMVTGSSGSIGSELCRQLTHFAPAKIVLLDRSETGQFFLERELHQLAPHANCEVCLGDINDAARMNTVFRTHRPDIVFHAAAYKHVPLMESHPGEAVKNITLATRLLADLADQNGVESFVMISTDKAVNPTSVMGACKRVAEQYIQSLAGQSSCRFVTVRFGNVLDSAGSVVPIFREQIARGGPVTVTHPEMVRYFMTIPEASQLVIQAGAMGDGGEIFVLDMGEPVRIVDLAADMIRLSGLRVGEDVEIEFTGLRPGEKMYEELYSDEELHDATAHSKILVAKSPLNTALTDVAWTLQELANLTEGTPHDLLEQLRLVVPEYRVPTRPAQLPKLAA